MEQPTSTTKTKTTKTGTDLYERIIRELFDAHDRNAAKLRREGTPVVEPHFSDEELNLLEKAKL